MLLVEPTKFPPVPAVQVAGETATRNRKDVGEPLYENVMFAVACVGLPELRATDVTVCPEQRAARKYMRRTIGDNVFFMGAFIELLLQRPSRESHAVC